MSHERVQLKQDQPSFNAHPSHQSQSTRCKARKCFYGHILLFLTMFVLLVSSNAEEDNYSDDENSPVISSDTIDVHENDEYKIIHTSPSTTKSTTTNTPRPAWWSKKMNKKPLLVANDAPIGTGVPTWREIDLFSKDELRTGRSYAGAALQADSRSSSLKLSSSSSLSIIILSLSFSSLLLSVLKCHHNYD